MQAFKIDMDLPLSMTLVQSDAVRLPEPGSSCPCCDAPYDSLFIPNDKLSLAAGTSVSLVKD